MHQFELAYNPSEAFTKGYRDLALAVGHKTQTALQSKNQNEMKSALIMAEVCGAICDKSMLELQWSVDGKYIDQFGQPGIPDTPLITGEMVEEFASDVAQRTPKYLHALGDVVVEHAHQVTSNPGPLFAGVALTVACPQAALAALVAELIINRKEHLQEAKEFCRLVHENTPQALAKATVVLGELYLLHKGTQVVRPEIEAAISRSSEAFAKMGSCAAEELEFALAAESTGGVQPATPTVNMLKNAAKTVERVEGEVAHGPIIQKGMTVWDSINPTQPVYPQTLIPESFEITIGNNSFWVHPNATKHMFEYITRPNSLGKKISEQMLLKSFSSAVEKALEQGIKYGAKIENGGWEIILSEVRAGGRLPVIYHAIYIP